MKPLNQLSGMPQITSAFKGWTKKISLVVVTQSIVDGFVQESLAATDFEGTIQPLIPEELKLKPEAQRSWEWLQIHCVSGNLNLKNNDRIIYNGKKYKVMAPRDYSLNGYIEYHCVEDYQNG